MNSELELRAAYATVIMARREAEEAEQALRQVALRIFAKGGKKRIAPGVSVHTTDAWMPYAIIADDLLWPEIGEAGGVE